MFWSRIFRSTLSFSPYRNLTVLSIIILSYIIDSLLINNFISQNYVIPVKFLFVAILVAVLIPYIRLYIGNIKYIDISDLRVRQAFILLVMVNIPLILILAISGSLLFLITAMVASAMLCLLGLILSSDLGNRIKNISYMSMYILAYTLIIISPLYVFEITRFNELIILLTLLITNTLILTYSYQTTAKLIYKTKKELLSQKYNHKFYIIRYNNIDDLISSMEYFNKVMDELIPSDVSAVLLLSKPIGPMYKLLKYIIDSLITSFTNENTSFEKFEEIITTSPLLMMSQKKVITISDSGAQHIILVVPGESYVIYNLVREFITENMYKKTLVLINDLADLSLILGERKTYSLIRDLGVLVHSGGGVMIALLPRGLMSERGENVFINLADYVIDIP